MKAVINEKETQVKKEYPCLMKSDSGIIILMKQEGCGYTITGSEITPVGTYSSEWPMNFFTPFTGSITLSND